MALTSPLLAIEDLTVALPSGGERAHAVEGISLTVDENEIVCLVGESGSGKSMTAHAVLGLLPPATRVAGGRVLFRGQDLVPLPPDPMRRLRGDRVAMIFQEPLSALNPLHRIGKQVAESLVVHGRPAEKDRIRGLFEAVGLPETLARAHPFALSGGQRQRAMIAMALANDPDLLIADEPTTALDVTTQKQILDLIRRLQAERRMGVLFITHDFGVVADLADRVVVMREGRIVESGPAAEVLEHPKHAYTRALIEAVPGRRTTARSENAVGTPLLEVRNLHKTFASSGGLFGARRSVTAAEDISFTLAAGESVALVGESGSGKSTLGRMILGLVTPDSGTIRLDGVDRSGLGGEALRQARRNVQIVFQDPFASLNPRQRIGDAIARGPMAFGMPRNMADAEAGRMLEQVGLPREAMRRFPHEFSGGQRQRIAIARALVLNPKILIADEPVSALDVSVQAQVLALLAELKQVFGLSLLFITHDLRVAGEIADRVLVMREGRIVEENAPGILFAAPKHPYTRELIDAVPGKSFAALMPRTVEA